MKFIKTKVLVFVFLIIPFLSCNNGTAIKYYTVKFDSDGGSKVEDQTIEEGKNAIKPNNPIKTNCSFGGWYKGNDLFDFTTPITKDITLKAKWEIATDTTPPGKVMNVSATSGNGYVQLSWTNPTDNDFATVGIIFSQTVQGIIQQIVIQGTHEVP